MEDRKAVLSRTMIVRDIFRHWPIWTISFIFYFFTVWLSNSVAKSFMSGERDLNSAVTVMDSLISVTTVAAFVMGLAASWAAFGFMENRRKHYFFESLPYSRRHLFINRFVFGFALCMIPCIAIFFMELFQMFALCGSFEMIMLLKWLLSALCEYFFWYSFGVLFFTVSGRAMMAVFCYIFFAVVGYLLSLYMELCNMACYIGFNMGTGSGNSVLGIFSPLHYVFGIQISDYWDYEKVGGVNGQLFLDGSALKLCVLFFAGVILTVAAFFLFKRRKSEKTGDTLVFKGMKYIFSWMITFFATLSVAFLLYGTIFYTNDAIAHRPVERVKIIVILSIVGFLLFLGSCMIVEKKFKVLKANWLKALIFTAVLAFLGTAYLHDAFNIEGYIPKQDEVKYIHSNKEDMLFEIYFSEGTSRIKTMSESSAIEVMTGLHKLILDNMDELEEMYTHTGAYDLSKGREINYYYLSISYKLKNDTNITRYYMIVEGSELDGKVRDYLGIKELKSNEPEDNDNDDSYRIDPEGR